MIRISRRIMTSRLKNKFRAGFAQNGLSAGPTRRAAALPRAIRPIPSGESGGRGDRSGRLDILLPDRDAGHRGLFYGEGPPSRRGHYDIYTVPTGANRGRRDAEEHLADADIHIAETEAGSFYHLDFSMDTFVMGVGRPIPGDVDDVVDRGNDLR